MFEKFMNFRVAMLAAGLVVALTVGVVGYNWLSHPAPVPVPPIPAPKIVFVIPKQHIVNNSVDAELGDVIELSVSKVGEDGPVPSYLSGSGYDWRVYEIVGLELKPKRFSLINDTKIHFGSGAQTKKYIVECYCTYLYTVKVGDKITDLATRNQLLTTVVNVVGPVPVPPGPGPEPKPPTPPIPPPPPVIPDGQYKLGKVAYDATMTKVVDVGRVKAAVALAKSFRKIAEEVEAGKHANAEAILAKTLENNHVALGSVQVPIIVWESAFRVLQDEIYALYQKRSINSLTDFKNAWLEIATGLEAVR